MELVCGASPRARRGRPGQTYEAGLLAEHRLWEEDEEGWKEGRRERGKEVIAGRIGQGRRRRRRRKR